MTELSCSDCGSRMEEGFIPDMAHGMVMRLVWHRGPAEKATFFGMATDAVRFRKQKTLIMTALRCTKCGLLKFYAPC